MALNKCGFDKFLKLTPLLKHKYYPLVSYNFIYFLVFILLPENSTIRSIDYCGTDLYMSERNVRLWIWATSEMSDWISFSKVYYVSIRVDVFVDIFWCFGFILYITMKMLNVMMLIIRGLS